MGVSSEEQGKQEASVDESVWFCLTRRFHFLATAMRKPRPLTVYESVSVEDHKFGTWVFSPPLDVLSRFEEAAIQAGKELGAPEGIDPLRFWLHHLSFHLWRRARRRYIRILDSGVNGVECRLRVLNDVIAASENFSRWLSNSASNAVTALNEISSESPPWIVDATNKHAEQSASNWGETWAVERNREWEARGRIVQAFQTLNVPIQEWPSFVQYWQADAHNRSKFSHNVMPPSFQPPVYDRLGQLSIAQWKKLADAAWEQHREGFLQRRQQWMDLGVDQEIPPIRRSRGPGKTERNVTIQDRYKWAALRLTRLPWKEIAARCQADTSTVTKAASSVLFTAGWPTKLSAIKAGSPDGVR